MIVRRRALILEAKFHVSSTIATLAPHNVVVVPMTVSELSPARNRWRILTGLFSIPDNFVRND
jgi:hypothetical protein